MVDSARGYRIALALSTIFLVIAAFGAGWVGSWLLQRADMGLTLPNGQRIGAASPATAAGEPVDGELALFWEAMGLLDAHFYTQENLPRGADLTYAAIEGIVQATGDPHTSFMDPERAEMVATSLEGEFEGIGAAVEMTEQGLVIVTPFPGTPADAAGLLPGDLVVEVDGTFTQGMDVMEAVSMVRGPEGTQVMLMVRREGAPDQLRFEITRARVVTPTVETRMIEEDGLPPVGYIRLFDFGGHSVEQFNAGLQELLDQGAERLIVDLRNNSGGYLRASVEITSQFIRDGLILSERGTEGRDNEYRAIPGGIALDIPMVVLTNAGSASASEIFAGAIRDHNRGTLIGTTTFGKGSVQITRDLSDNSSLRITVARWYTPSGTAIHEVGIEPDIVVDWDPEAVAPGEDPQLDAAIEFFREAQ